MKTLFWHQLHPIQSAQASQGGGWTTEKDVLNNFILLVLLF